MPRTHHHRSDHNTPQRSRQGDQGKDRCILQFSRISEHLWRGGQGERDRDGGHRHHACKAPSGRESVKACGRRHHQSGQHGLRRAEECQEDSHRQNGTHDEGSTRADHGRAQER